MSVEPVLSPRSGFARLFDGAGGTATASTEGQLLARFVATRDELAFEAIVQRHGPMVAGVCQSILGDPAAADDAFQATFLILVQRAESFRAVGGLRHLALSLRQIARRQPSTRGGARAADQSPRPHRKR